MGSNLKDVQKIDRLLKTPQFNRQINFGKNDASISFTNEDSCLILSGSNNGVAISGSGVFVDTGTVAAGTAADASSFLALNSDNKIVKSSVVGSSARSVSGDTDNGIISWVTSDNTFAVESNLTFDGTDLTIGSAGKINFRDTNSFINSPTANDLEIVATDIVLDAATLIDLQSDAVSIGENADTDVVLTFNGNSNDGTITWMEDEAEFHFNSPVKGKILYYTHHNYNYTSNQLHYIPLNSTVEATDIELEFTHWLAPYDGKLIKVIVNSDGDHAFGGTAAGSTVIGLHLDRNTTAATTVTETLTQSSAGVGVTQTFNFTSNNTFSAGQFLSISVDAHAALYDMRVTCVWEYDTTT